MSDSLVKKARLKLGLTEQIQADLPGLTAVYRAWSQGVGYDNINLIKYLDSSQKNAVPGLPVEDFFSSWLELGVANFCWANSEALRVVLKSFGFRTTRVVGSMGTWRKLQGAFVLPHGSLMAQIGDQSFLVDATFLIEEPLPIIKGQDTTAGAGSLQVWLQKDGKIRWQLPQSRFDVSFEIMRDDIDYAEFETEHHKTVNGLQDGRLYRDKLYIRRNFDGGTITLDQGYVIRRNGKKFTIDKLDRDQPAKEVQRIFNLTAAALEGLPAESFH